MIKKRLIYLLLFVLFLIIISCSPERLYNSSKTNDSALYECRIEGDRVSLYKDSQLIHSKNHFECKGQYLIIENYCKYNNPKTIGSMNLGECTLGTICKNGRCIFSELIDREPLSNPDPLIDPEDNSGNESLPVQPQSLASNVPQSMSTKVGDYCDYYRFIPIAKCEGQNKNTLVVRRCNRISGDKGVISGFDVDCSLEAKRCEYGTDHCVEITIPRPPSLNAKIPGACCKGVFCRTYSDLNEHNDCTKKYPGKNCWPNPCLS